MHISKEIMLHACLTDILCFDASLVVSMDSACSFFSQSFCPTRKAMGTTDAVQMVSDVSQILQQNPMLDMRPNMLYFKIPLGAT